MKVILVASTNMAACETIQTSMRTEYTVEVKSSSESCLQAFKKKRYEFLFIDIDLLLNNIAGNDYRAALQPYWRVYPSACIVAMAPQKAVRGAVRAVKAGANDYLTYPISPEEVSLVTESAYESLVMESELDYLRDQFWDGDYREFIQTQNLLMREVFERVRSVSPTRSTVLLSGETGTGKGVLARLIHRHSNRKDGPFISVHCGAIPDTLIESELFGHEKGAFTGAIRRKLGKFEIAQEGTIFLDEIGTITPPTQIKLLEILQEGIFHRLGGETDITADVRVIAATNSDLKDMLLEGNFRKDLYYRLNVFPLEIPPLRERPEDIPHIARVVLAKLNRFHSQDIHDIGQPVIDAFKRYSWPGNIREMENLMERAYILEKTQLLTPDGFPEELFSSHISDQTLMAGSTMTLAEMRHNAVERAEKRYLCDLLTVHKGLIKDTAKAAGISTRQLHKLMKKHTIKKENYKSRAA